MQSFLGNPNYHVTICEPFNRIGEYNIKSSNYAYPPNQSFVPGGKSVIWFLKPTKTSPEYTPTYSFTLPLSKFNVSPGRYAVTLRRSCVVDSISFVDQQVGTAITNSLNDQTSIYHFQVRCNGASPARHIGSLSSINRSSLSGSASPKLVVNNEDIEFELEVYNSDPTIDVYVDDIFNTRTNTIGAGTVNYTTDEPSSNLIFNVLNTAVINMHFELRRISNRI